MTVWMCPSSFSRCSVRRRKLRPGAQDSPSQVCRHFRPSRLPKFNACPRESHLRSAHTSGPNFHARYQFLDVYRSSAFALLWIFVVQGFPASGFFFHVCLNYRLPISRIICDCCLLNDRHCHTFPFHYAVIARADFNCLIVSTVPPGEEQDTHGQRKRISGTERDGKKKVNLSLYISGEPQADPRDGSGNSNQRSWLRNI